MIDFILNDRNIRADAPLDSRVLDFLRKSRRLVGVKEGCREGACGACLVLVGELDGKTISYRSMNSCLLPLAEIEGKHVVTIEGLDDGAVKVLNPIQQAILDDGATQCGYCTPGIILALTGLFLENPYFDQEQATDAVSGNICRCTGYQSIKRAAIRLCDMFSPSDSGDEKASMARLVEKRILPPYFLQIPERLREMPVPDEPPLKIRPDSIVVGGGTALWGRENVEPPHTDLIHLSRREELKGIRLDGDRCYVGAATTFEEVQDSPIMQRFFPRIGDYFKLIASKPIRHRITVGGNIADAVPYADAAVFFLAMGASVVLTDRRDRREVALKDFFKGYRQPDKEDGEFVEAIRFPTPTEDTRFNFENISKRPHLDISSVNSAAQITMKNGVMARVHLSAGGVAPVPLYLSGASRYLTGKTPKPDTVREAAAIAQSESSPISDVRGSAKYKRLLLRQLIYAHFITLFPERITLEGLR